MNTEELKVHNNIDPICEAYHEDTLLGTIFNATELYDFLAQVHTKFKNEECIKRKPSGYYVKFNDEKLNITKEGKIHNSPDGFYDKIKEYTEIIFDIYD